MEGGDLMLKSENVEKRERIYYKWCTVLVLVFECFAAAGVLISIIDLIRVAAASLDVAAAETYYGTQYFTVTMTYEYTPVKGYITEDLNLKVFETVWIIVQLFSSQIPYLILFDSVRRMLRRIGTGHSPLNPDAVPCIQMAGAAMIFLSVCKGLIEQLVMGMVIYGHVVISNPVSMTGLFGGLLILVFAGIYRRGCRLQQDADETI